LDAPDIGNLFHEALKKITEWIQGAGKDFSNIYKKEAEGYARQAVEKLAPVLQHEILMSSNRYQYIQQKLLEVISRATYILSEKRVIPVFHLSGWNLVSAMMRRCHRLHYRFEMDLN